MNIFNRKGQKTIDFISAVEGLTEAVPIRRAIEMMPDWAKACRKDFTKDKTQPLHLAKCPGIFDLYKVGYVVPMWCDVAIETQGCLLYTSPSPRDRTRSRMPSSA